MYYDMYILSNLFYALQTCWLNETELKRLDAAHCRFLRVILGIPYSSVSRISNAVVLAKAGRSPARFLLLKRQLLLYGQIVRLPKDDVLRASLIRRDGIQPAHFTFRKKGGQHAQWADKLFAHIHRTTNSAIWSKVLWGKEVNRYIADLHGDYMFYR